MNRIIRLFSIGILSVFLFGIASTQDVLACSGGRASSINERVNSSDVIVRGRVIETDNSGDNAIIQVAEYLKGEGDEFILISIVSKSFILSRRLRPDSGGCFYGLLSTYPDDKDIVIFLYKNFNGSYGLAKGNHTNIEFYIADELMYIYEDRFGVRVWRGVNYNQFVTVVENITGENATQPTPNQQLPLRAPMVIITDIGTKYILPIDESLPVLPSELDMYKPHLEEFLEWLGDFETNCWGNGCHSKSSSLLDNGRITSEGVDIIYYGTARGFIRNGKGFAFSPTNEGIVAVWKEENTSIFDTEIIIQIHRYEHPFMGFPMEHSFILNTDTFYPYSGAWSPRGRFLAYADTDGIYLWDVFTQNSSPQLLLKTRHKIIHGFSPTGRFLMLGSPDDGFSYRLQDGSVHPIGAFSPNDRILLPYQNPSQIIYYFPSYRVDTIELPDELAGYHIQKIVWAGNNRFYRLMCEEQSCFVAGGDIHHQIYTPHPLIQARDFDYDALNDQLVILRDDWNITITTPFGTQEYDLSAYLDSPIASIEWLPSLFYYDD